MYNYCVTISYRIIIKEEQIVRNEARSILKDEVTDVEYLKFGDVVKEWMLVKKKSSKRICFL